MTPAPAQVSRWLAALLALAAGAALAQGVYRHVGPDGRVTFSDQPPATGSATASTTPGAPPAAEVALPFALRQVTQRYPVTLYTTKDCAPCTQGRDLLRNRGVPYTEKTVTTAEDLAAFAKVSGVANGSLPRLHIGAQALDGYAAAEWHQYLDAAGYPRQSALPRNYRAPEAAALAPQATPTPAPAPTAAAAPRPPQARSAPAPVPEQPAIAPPGPTPDNPAGIRF